jgi:hypothetical protein
MSLWHLLIATSSSPFLGGAVAAVRVTSGGARNYLVATVIGILLAVANAWTWSKVAATVDRHIKAFSDADREWYLPLLYLAVAIWGLCAGPVGLWIALGSLRLVSREFGYSTRHKTRRSRLA